MKPLALLLLPVTLAFVEFPAGEKFKAGEKITVSTALEHDFYAAGETIEINAPIAGDLVAAAGSITIRDSIQEDLTVAGGEVVVDGRVGDDIIAMGGDIRIPQPIGGDLIVMGGDITIDKTSTVGQDLVVMGGNVNIAGTIAGNLIARGGKIVLDGACEGNLEMKGGRLEVNGPVQGTSVIVAENMRVGPNAQFYGNVRYWLPNEDAGQDFTAALRNNATAQYDETLQTEDGFSWFGQIPWFFLIVAYILSVFLLIVLLHLLLPRVMERAGQALRQDFVKSFGYGALYLVGIPLAVILLFMTFIGIPIGLFVLAMFLFSLLFGHALAAVAITYAINIRREHSWSKIVLMFISLGIFIVLRSLTFTPMIGIFVSVILVGASFGALIIPLVRKKEAVPA